MSRSDEVTKGARGFASVLGRVVSLEGAVAALVLDAGSLWPLGCLTVKNNPFESSSMMFYVKSG